MRIHYSALMMMQNLPLTYPPFLRSEDRRGKEQKRKGEKEKRREEEKGERRAGKERKGRAIKIFRPFP